MKRILWLIIAGVILAVGYLAYVRSLSPKPQPTMQASVPVVLSVGQEYTISLDETPTAGYSWEVEPYDKAIVELVSSKSERSPESVGKMGGNSIRTFVLKGLKPGNTKFTLTYKRSQENAVKDTRTYHVTVNSTTMGS